MSTGTYIVKRALQKIGASSAVSEASPESIDTAFNTLNSMIALWTSQGIDTGAVYIAVVADELGEKQDCQNAIISNLAVMVAPDFDNGNNIVSQALIGEARRELGSVKSLYRSFVIPKKVVSSTLPVGQGNTQDIYDGPFFEEGDSLGN